MSRIDTGCTDPRPDRREDLALLAGGDLPPEEAARLEAHAGTCPACRELLAGLRQSGAALALLADDELAADPIVLARVREGVRAGVARLEAEEEREGLGAPPRWALAAVLLVALVAAAVWLRSGPLSDPLSDPGVDPGSDPPAEQAAEGDPGAAAPSRRPPETDPQDAPVPPTAPETGTAGPPPADRVARAEPADRPVTPSAGGPEARPPGEAAGSDPVDTAAGAPSDAHPTGPGAEPQITIRVVSDDPDIVFYWLVEPEENRDEETVSS